MQSHGWAGQKHDCTEASDRAAVERVVRRLFPMSVHFSDEVEPATAAAPEETPRAPAARVRGRGLVADVTELRGGDFT